MATQTLSKPVFIVSGGGRGITAQCVIQLAKALPGRWILLGRSERMAAEPVWATGCEEEAELKKRILQDFVARGEKPTPMQVNRLFRSVVASREIATTIKTLESLGSEAVYVSADVTDLDMLKARLAPAVQQFGSVTGLIHGAGNLADKLIENKTEQDFEKVYDTKIEGLSNLLGCVPVQQLQYLVLFSSVAGFYGNAGQTDYALANEILNRIALQVNRQHPNCRSVAINWGPWESGMVTPVLKKAFAERGIDILPVDEATQMLVNELSSNHQDTAVVVVGSPIEPPMVLLEGGLKKHRLRRRLTLAENPFLLDHVISGSPVMPFTCMISWIADGGKKLYPNYHCFLYEDIKVLKGIIFNESLANEYILELQEISKDEEAIVFEGKILSEDAAGRVRYHFSSRLTMRRERPIPPRLTSIDLTSDGVISETNFYQNEASSLFHGASFRGLRRILNITPELVTGEYFARCIESRTQGQFPVKTLDPYLSDIQTHSVWIWLRHFHQSVCLPAKLARFENFSNPPYDRPFYSTTRIVSKTATKLVIDITVHDEQGEVYTFVEGAEATIFPLVTQVA